MRVFYTIVALLVIAGYGFAGWNGLELSQTKKGFAPQSVRGAHGGSRTFWYSGYRGGK